jgi:hypothetical protein
LSGICDNAEPAADLAAFVAFGFCKVVDAAVPTFGEVTFIGAFVCESADPAADFAALLAVELCNTFAAADAAFLPVVSFLFGMS